MAQQMAGQAGGILGQMTPAAGSVPPPIPVAGGGSGAVAAAASPLPDLLSPAEAGQLLGVSEADVLAALGDGSLKGKKIGSTWRLSRSAVLDFLKN